MFKRGLFSITLILSLIFVLGSVNVYASITYVPNNFNNYVEPRNGVIRGENIKYSFFIPETWSDKVNVYRKAGEIGDNYLEKLSFYYSPNGSGDIVNKTNECLFLTITVYAHGQNIQSSDEKTLFTESGYTFTSSVSSKNNYKDNKTRKEFNSLVSNSKSTSFLRKYLSYNTSNPNISSSKIYYKNISISSNSYIDENDVVYIPLREFASIMGYQVTWYESVKAVRITKGDVSDIIYHNNDNGSYQTKIINDRIYVTTNYLRDKWNVSIYIDNKNNVYIS